jgi:serpin B
MRRIIPLPLLLIALVAAACGSATSAATTTVEPSSLDRAGSIATAPIADLAAGFNNAGFDILRSQPLGDNAVLSPASIGHAVLMARAAADESTGAAIDDALNLPDGVGAHDAWNAIDHMIDEANGATTDINQEPTPIITIADRIWPAAGVTPDQDWVDLLATHHGAEVSTIDVTQPEVSRAEINQWVSDATQELIPELLPAGFINGNTTLVLTDAVYFKAQWQSIFGKYGTIDADFHNLDGTTQTTSFMRDLENGGARGIGDGWVAANLPYRGDTFSMLVVVPDEGNFAALRDRLSDTLLAEIDAAIEPGPYELLLPKWDDDANIDLLPWLTEVGAAPGSYPAISPGSFLSGGVHAADIAVDEIGTIAAAATGLGFDESGPPEPEITIAADKPFFYVIRHDESGLVLFAGQVTDPN